MGQSPTPDSSWKNFPSWLFFAFLIIGPPTALLAFTQRVTQNPVLVGLLVLGYEILLFVVRFTGKIWQQLEVTLVTYIAQWLTVRTQEITSRYYRHYFQYLVYEHQVFDIKGFGTRTAHDLELEQVFVDLCINSTPPHRASADPLHLPEFLQGIHSIWDYLSNTTLANSHLVILGPPGSGKTTLLKHIALVLARSKKHSWRLERHTFPILLFLRDHTHAIMDQPDFSLPNAIHDHIQQAWQQTIPSTWIGRHLASGKCLVLLDGLDEVADSSTRKLVVAWIQRQLLTYGHNRFVLTSRPYGYRDNPLEGITVLDVQPFTSDQVEQFVHNWYLANELKSWGKDDPGVHMRVHVGTRDILQRLHQAPALLELAVNPLLLTMIATVHRYRSSLPGKRIELYAEMCEVFLGKRHEARGIAQDLSPAQKQQVLQPLAYFLMQQGTREIERQIAQQVIAPALALVNAQMQPVDYLQLIENTSGLLLERNPGIYSFAHLTFQEFLAAVYIKEEGLESILVDQVANSWWHETIRLYCAQTDATALIQACLAGNPPTVTALTLAFECDKEKLKIQPQAQGKLNEVLEAGGEDPDPERRHVIAKALLTQRSRQMVHLRQKIYIDKSLISCAEYQMFLDEQRAQGKYYQPDHWTNTFFPAGLGRSPVVGIRRSDAQVFCDWLNAQNLEGKSYRLPRLEERPPQEGSRQRELSAETGYWIEDEPFFAWSQGKRSDVLHRQLSDYIASVQDKRLDYNFDRCLDLAVNIDRIFNLDQALIFERDINLARDRARARDRDRAIDKDFDLALKHALKCNTAFNDTVREAHAKDRTNVLNLAPALDCALDLVFALKKVHARAQVLVLDRVLGLERDLELVLDLYVTLLLMQGRITGILPAFEGILLVKENR